VGPVSNPISSYEKVDWISEIFDGDESVESGASNSRLVLLGSCDLTAVATYCSSNRAEYVNSVEDGVMVRYDDFGFLLNNEGAVEQSTALDELPAWSKADFKRFQEDIVISETVILSLSAAMKGAYFLTNDGVVVRLHPMGLGHYIDLHPRAGFLSKGAMYAITDREQLELLESSLARIDGLARNAKHIFLLGANTRDSAGAFRDGEQEALRAYNVAAKAFCDRNDGWLYVSIDDVVAEDQLVDDRHYTRLGYFGIAAHIIDRAAKPSVREGQQYRVIQTTPSITDLVKSGRKLRRFELVGSHRGAFGQAIRAVSLTPLSGLLRKAIGKPAVDVRKVLEFN
jgi:hypothetical protein